MNAGESTLALRRWATPADASFAEPVFIFAQGELPDDLTNAIAVLPNQDASIAKELLARGASQVLLCDAALLDSSQVKPLVDEFGKDRVGVWLPAKRMEVSWTLDTESNADFRFVTPSICEPCWEVLKSDLTRTGTELGCWVEQMLGFGVTTVVISIDIADDTDLNICAGLVERFGEHLWLSPLLNQKANFPAWVEYGHATNLILPDEAYRDAEVMAALQGSSEPA